MYRLKDKKTRALAKETISERSPLKFQTKTIAKSSGANKNAVSMPTMSARHENELYFTRKDNAKVFQQRLNDRLVQQKRARKDDIAVYPGQCFEEETPEMRSPRAYDFEIPTPLIIPPRRVPVKKRCDIRSVVSKQKKDESRAGSNATYYGRENKNELRSRTLRRRMPRQRLKAGPVPSFAPSDRSLQLCYPTLEEKQQALTWRIELQSMLDKMPWDQVPLDFFIDEAVEETNASRIGSVSTSRAPGKACTSYLHIRRNKRRSAERDASTCPLSLRELCDIFF